MKYNIDFTRNFKKQYNKVKKQGKDLNKLYEVIEALANYQELAPKYKNHRLVNNKIFVDCQECYIEPDWLLVYKISGDQLILLLYATGSHSELFK